MPKKHKMHNFPSVPESQSAPGTCWVPWGRKGSAPGAAAHYNPCEKGTQLCKASLKMLFVKDDTHLSLLLVLSTEVKPCLHPRLKKLNFQSRPTRGFLFWLMVLVVAPEQFGVSEIKLVLSNLKVHLWLFYVRCWITRKAGISI